MSKDLNRREFLLLTAAAVTGPEVVRALQPAAAEHVIDAGPASDYGSDGVYSGFQNQGFFVVRRGAELFAVSSFCTHRHCKVATQADRSYYCRCHGSTFDPNGKVTEGPAKRDLPRFSTSVSDKQHLLVKVTG